MSDVIDRLRAADPERECSPPSSELLGARLDQEARRATRRGLFGSGRRAGELLVPAVGLAVVLVIAAVALTLRHGTTAHPGGGAAFQTAAGAGTLVSYTVTDVFVPARSSGVSFSAQRTTAHVWIAGSRSHSLATVTYVPKQGGYVHEVAVNGNMVENYQGGPATRTRIAKRGSCVTVVVCAPGIPADPVATFAHLRAQGSFTPDGTTVLDDNRQLESYRSSGPPRIRALVDQSTGVPVRLIVRFGRPGTDAPTDTIEISNYRRAPLSAANARLLLMHPRPQCHTPSCLPGVHRDKLRTGRIKIGTPFAPSGTTPPGPIVLLAQINLAPAVGASRGPAGVIQEVRRAGMVGIIVHAIRIPANRRSDRYAIWLYSSQSSSRLLGFVYPGVKRNGRLYTAGILPKNAPTYREILITRETEARPRRPGPIVLSGTDTLR